MMRPFPIRALMVCVLVAVCVRVAILLTGTVSFHSDEAIVGLIAKHILDGQHRAFFWGQAYMGTLNAYPIALGFALLGESVATIRIVQTALFAVSVGMGFATLYKLTAQTRLAVWGGMLLAVPPLVGVLYTSISIGGYLETLIMGYGLVWLTVALYERPSRAWMWALIGFVGGVAWWTNALIVAFGVPCALALGWRLSRQRSLLPLLGLAVVGFVVGSMPFWVFNFTHANAALAAIFPIPPPPEFARVGIQPTRFTDRLLGLVVLGLPTSFGMRHPWASYYILPPLGLGVWALLCVGAYRLARASALPPLTRFLALGIPITLLTVFLVSNFGGDPTGRYFLPLLLSYSLFGAVAIDALWSSRRWLGVGVMIAVIGYMGLGTLDAIRHSDVGITPQFDLVTHLPNADDAELVAFLEAQDLTRGYSTYWLTFRLAYLSDERLQYSATLPNKTDLSYNPTDNRHAPYVEAVRQAEQVAIITTDRLPHFEGILQAKLDAYTYSMHEVGIYNVYYDFTPPHPQLTFNDVASIP